MVVAVTLAVSAGTAQASTIFLSTTSTAPALINPTLTMAVGGTAALYVFWEPSTDASTGYNEQLSGWGHNLVATNDTLMSRVTYTYLNPSIAGTPRWGSTNAGTGGGSFLVQGANAVKVGGSNLGFGTGLRKATAMKAPTACG